MFPHVEDMGGGGVGGTLCHRQPEGIPKREETRGQRFRYGGGSEPCHNWFRPKMAAGVSHLYSGGYGGGFNEVIGNHSIRGAPAIRETLLFSKLFLSSAIHISCSH